MLEAIAPPLDRYQSGFGSLRVDKYFSGDRVLTLEGGASTFEGTTNVSDLGRVQQTDVSRPWIRFNLNAPRWNVLASSSRRTADDQAVLSSGGTLFLDSSTTAVEVQGNTVFGGGRGRAVGGAYLGVQYADSRNPQGVHTIYSSVADERDGAVYGQVDYHFTRSLGGVFSLRWDGSTLHDARWSPRAAVVYTAAPGHTLRFTYNDGFKRPTWSELFVKVPVAPPVDLSALEQALAPVLGGVSLGFASIPLLAIGNEDLTVEEIQSVELGYNAVLGSTVFVTASLYYNRLRNFTTTLLPQLGTSFGRLNERYGPYTPPSALSPGSAAAVVAYPRPNLVALDVDAVIPLNPRRRLHQLDDGQQRRIATVGRAAAAPPRRILRDGCVFERLQQPRLTQTRWRLQQHDLASAVLHPGEAVDEHLSHDSCSINRRDGATPRSRFHSMMKGIPDDAADAHRYQGAGRGTAAAEGRQPGRSA